VGSASGPIARSVEEDPTLLESPHRPLRSADEFVGEAGRLREPIPDGAGKDDPLRGVQVDQVTDAGEDPIGKQNSRKGARPQGRAPRRERGSPIP